MSDSVGRDRTPERADALMPFGFTERQARFLVMVMLHSGVFMGRHYATFAGITQGQKVHDFIARLLAARYATAFRLGKTGRTRLIHVHYKPMYAAIGEPDNRNRKPIALGRAIERMMLLDVVLTEHSLVWLASERDKRRHFILRLRGLLRMEEYPRLVFGKGAAATVRYFPDKLPVGFDPEDERHVFLYLVTARSPADFRTFLQRHAELLGALRRWTIRLILPAHLKHRARVFHAAGYEHLAMPVHPSLLEPLKAAFRRCRTDGETVTAASLEPARGVTPPRRSALAALYRRWLTVGDGALDLAASTTLRNAMERGEGRIESTVLTHRYLHLSALIGTA